MLVRDLKHVGFSFSFFPKEASLLINSESRCLLEDRSCLPRSQKSGTSVRWTQREEHGTVQLLTAGVRNCHNSMALSLTSTMHIGGYWLPGSLTAVSGIPGYWEMV